MYYIIMYMYMYSRLYSWLYLQFLLWTHQLSLTIFKLCRLLWQFLNNRSRNLQLTEIETTTTTTFCKGWFSTILLNIIYHKGHVYAMTRCGLNLFLDLFFQFDFMNMNMILWFFLIQHCIWMLFWIANIKQLQYSYQLCARVQFSQSLQILSWKFNASFFEMSIIFCVIEYSNLFKLLFKV